MKGHGRTLLAAIGSVLLVVMGSGTASALLAVGDPWEGESWSQRFNESGVGDFDVIAVWMTSADSFESPVFRNFSNGSWQNILTATPSTSGRGEGTAATSLEFDIAFAGASSNPLVFNFASYDYDGQDYVAKDWANASWSGSGWTITGASGNAPPPPAGVPEPASLCLLALAMGGVGAGLRRRRRAA